MKIKRSVLAPLLVALTALVTGGWLLQQGTQERNVYLQERLFEEVLHRISDRFVEEKEPSELYRMAIEGLLKQLGDPHSVFMTPDEYNRLRVQTQGEYGGLGIRIAVRNEWVTVIAPLPGTPAERAGLQAGDRIIAVEGESTRGWTADDAVAALRGPEGAPVDIKVARVGIDQPIPFHIVRAEIHIQAVPTDYVIGGDIGYVRMLAFRESSTRELRKAVDRLREKGINGLIIDLRRNPGGLLDQSIAVADLFLKEGAVVAETRSRIESQNQVFKAVDDAHYAGLPVVVIVGPGSASAAEILAGALQDHDRALIIGQSTFGKGSVQTLFPLPGDNYLKLTTARWYTPSGRSIQKPYGIGADEDVAAQDTAREVFRTDAGRQVLGGGGIHPDLIVDPDSATEAEQAFIEAIGEHGSEYYDALYSFAVEYGVKHEGLEPGFAVTPQMLTGFYRALQEAEIDVERSIYRAASDRIGRALAIEITRAEWGTEARQKRINLEDPQVQTAVRLLRRADDPESLFAAAERYREKRTATTEQEKAHAAATN